jgi:hypothetical protein
VRSVPAGYPIYAGLSVGIPSPTLTSTPDSIRDAIRVAHRAGAAGIMLSRNYMEQERAQLVAAGEAIGEILAERGAS